LDELQYRNAELPSIKLAGTDSGVDQGKSRNRLYPGQPGEDGSQVSESKGILSCIRKRHFSFFSSFGRVFL